MKLVTVRITKFKSIEDSGVVPIEPDVTTFVGQNESGKTAFLKALHKARPVEEGQSYDVTDDYPRKDLADYEEHHETNPDVVATLTYEIEEEDASVVNDDLEYDVLSVSTFQITHRYDNSTSILLSIPEGPYVKHLLSSSGFATKTLDRLEGIDTIDGLIATLSDLDDLSPSEAEASENIQTRFRESGWQSRLSYYVWKKHLSARVPKFFYFDDYRILPGKANLPDIVRRIAQKDLRDEDQAVLNLLRVANISIDTLLEPEGYERNRARLEGTSSKITGKVFKYWRQNPDLRVVFDVYSDPNDDPPYNSGKNLYIRIDNPRHHVTVPFDQRSKGFIWFFSFITWFDAMSREGHTGAILLLDEPGLSLHALAQADFLSYIDDLAQSHQILYSTHSPFMVRSSKLHRVRTVEDKVDTGTLITSDVSGSDSDTLFPLQAALGYSIAQNLFIGERNLLVEGISDLLFLEAISNYLETNGHETLDSSIVITPVGGIKKVSAFVSLFGANDLDIAVIHDFDGSPDQSIASLIKAKMVKERHILNYAMFREKGGSEKKSDVEDLFQPSIYLTYFNRAYSKQLNGTKIKVGDLPPGDRILSRIDRHLLDLGIQLRPSGGFNHFLPARAFAEHPPKKLDEKTRDRFTLLFRRVNALLGS